MQIPLARLEIISLSWYQFKRCLLIGLSTDQSYYLSGIRLNGMTVADHPLATQTGVRVIDNSAYIAVDIELNTGGIETFIVSHADPSVTFSGYLVGIADRESYCI